MLNLKKLNTFIVTDHFKMEDIRTATKLMPERGYMASLDLKDAYFFIPIHKSSRKYLRFQWKGQIYEWTCVPFGLSLAPWLYTKIMKSVANFLREKGLLSVVYLDDWLCFGRTEEECARNVQLTRRKLESLSFVINEEKSCMVPNTRCQFLGFVLDSVSKTLELPESKRIQLVNLIKTLRGLKSCSIREFSRTVGSISASCPAIQYGRLYSKGLERQKYLALLRNNGDYEGIMTISQSLVADLDWWEENIQSSRNPIRQQKFVLEIFSDASTTGWGQHAKEKSLRVSGTNQN